MTTKPETNADLFKSLAVTLAASNIASPEKIWLRATLEALILKTPGPRRLEDLRLLAEQSDAVATGHRRVRITCPDASLTEDETLVVQALLGYHPAGYGFPSGFVARPDGEGVSWTCSNTCD